MNIIKKILKTIMIKNKTTQDSIYPNYTRFCVLGHARTGSNYLTRGLAHSKQVKMYNEIFAKQNRTKGKDFNQIINDHFGRIENGISHIGFKLFYYHLTLGEWERILALKDFKIIHLKRKNKLRTIVSLLVAFKTDQWTITSNSSQIKSSAKIIHIDVDTLISKIEEIENYENKTELDFKGREILNVYYEDLVNERTSTFQEICNFLNLDFSFPIKIKLKKQNIETLEELIINYDEVCSLLRNTKYEPYLYN